MTAPTARNGRTETIESKLAPPTPPICQDLTFAAMSFRGSATALMNDASAGDRGPDDAGRRPQAEPRHPRDDRERGAHVDPEDAGVGERVAGDALHDASGEPERRADERGEHGAGDALDDGGLPEIVGPAAESRDEVVPADVARADRDGGDREQDEDDEHRAEPEHADAPRAPHGGGARDGPFPDCGHSPLSAAAASSST